MFTILIVVAIVFLICFKIVKYIDSLPEKRLKAQRKKEHWGEFIYQPKSEIYWDLGRTVFVKQKRLDSRHYLENLGFKFLGYSNEVLLWVEPPHGWKMKHLNSSLWTEILDETGKLRFRYFYKNDIGNMSDYRAELHEVI